VLMIIQSRHVFEVFMGRDSGWRPQRRDSGGTTWGDAWHFHKRHTFFSGVTAVIIWFLSPPLLAWVSPALLGLLLSVPLSRISGSVWVGRVLSRVALLRTPEEVDQPSLIRRRRELTARAAPLPVDALSYLARNGDARMAHSNGNLERPLDPRGRPDPHALTAAQKLSDAGSLDEALQWLSPIERIEVAADPRLLDQLALLPDAPRPMVLI
jgi:membrane glycosyltransferase